MSATHLPNPCYNKFLPISKEVGNKKDYNKEKFDNATQNWMNFQASFKPEETFKTTTQQDIPQMEDRKEKFKLRQNNLTKNE